MVIREASAKDAEDLKVLYFEYLTKYPPEEEQNMDEWRAFLDEYSKDRYNYILVAEEDGRNPEVPSIPRNAPVPSL